MPTQSVSAPRNKMEAARLVLERSPDMDQRELQEVLEKEFGMHMSPKQSANYRRNILREFHRPARPERNGSVPSSNGHAVKSVKPATQTDLAELIRLGNALGWERVKEVAEIAVQVRK